MNKKITCSLLVFSILFQVVFTAPGFRVKRADGDNDSDDLNPVSSQDGSPGAGREKRKLPEAKFAGKNAILGFVFGASKSSAGAASSSGQQKTPTSLSNSESVDDIPELDRNKVSLDIPDDLFSNSITTVTNISKSVGNFIMGSARRYAQLITLFQPLLGKHVTIKGAVAPPPETDSDSDSRK